MQCCKEEIPVIDVTKEEGPREAIKQMVINMKQKQYTIETIAEITGLTKVEVENILS